ncbi:MAG: DUF2769 domain-containing protein [Candidatus Thorarchaeota archaeon]
MSDPIETWSEDSFEQKYTMMMGGMSEADQKKAAVNVIHLCKCSTCPTNCATGEINAVFCTFGNSKEIVEQKGCFCSECAITKTMSLRWEYFCTQGSAVELSDLNK